MDALEVAEQFFTAIGNGDVDAVRSLYSPDVVIWHNFDGLDKRDTGESREENLKVLASLPAAITGARYDIWFRERTESGFVQQHVLRGNMLNGEEFELPACIVCKVVEGKITRLDEYFDPAISEHLKEVVIASLSASAP